MVKSADRVFQVLEFIVDNRDGLSHKELSSELDIPKSSLSALLSNLVSREYLSYNTVNKRYRLGPKVLSLAGRHLLGLEIVQLGQSVVHKVMVRTEESVELAVRSGHRIQIVCKVDCFRPLLGLRRESLVSTLLDGIVPYPECEGLQKRTQQLASRANVAG